MKSFFYYLSIALVLIATASCSKTEKAIDGYCNCMNEIVSDSLLSSDLIDESHKHCLDSVTERYNLSDNKEFIAELNANEKVVTIRKTIDSTILVNIESYLETHYFRSEPKESFLESMKYWKYNLDGNVYSVSIITIWGDGDISERKNEYSGKYEITKEKNGKYYVTFIDNNQWADKEIYEFTKVDKTSSYDYILSKIGGFFLYSVEK